MGTAWESEGISGKKPANIKEEDVALNTCVIRIDKKKEKGRSTIEEDYRQLKDVWGLDHFTSTKYKNIVFHIVMMLAAYLFYQVYKYTEAGAKYGNKSLSTILDTYELSNSNDLKIDKVTIYYKNTFGIIDFVNFP